MRKTMHRKQRGEAQAPQATGEIEELMREPPPAAAGGECRATHRLATAVMCICVRQH
jgi:hypothetical protein